MATWKQNKDFEEDVFDGAQFLDRAIVWIKNNMPIGEVYGEGQIKNHIEDQDPADYFSESTLSQWAEENGYVKPE